MRTTASIALLVLSALCAVLLIPESPWRHLGDPAYNAAPGTVAFLFLVLGLRLWSLRNPARIAAEPWLFALFLASMPTVYIGSWFRSGQAAPHWLWIELAGLALFSTLAVLGMRRSYLWIAVGIVGHGIGWDLWHRFSQGAVPYVPFWYVDACLIIDLGFGGYVALQRARWQQARPLPQAGKSA